MKRPCICIVAGFALGEVLAYAIMERDYIPAVISCFAAFIFCAILVLEAIMAKTNKRRVLIILGLALLFGAARLSINKLTLPAYDRLDSLCTESAESYETEITDITVKDKRLTLRCGELIVYYTPAWDASSPLYSPDDSYFDNYTATDTSSAAYGEELAHLFSIGNHIRVTGDFEPMDKPRNPGEFNFYLYYLADGVTHRCFADSIEITDSHINTIPDYIFRLRRSLLGRIDAVFDDEDSGVLRAVLLGDKTTLSEDLNELYRKNGIAHLLAISGLHVSIIGMTLYQFLRKKLKLSYTICALVCGVWILFYCILTGAGVSTVRATIMLILIFLAGSLGAHYDMLSSAGFAAMVILLIHPYQLFNCSFLMSFACIIAIAGPAQFIIKELLGRPVTRHRPKFITALLESLILSITIQLFTLPVTAYFFFEVSLYGCLLNLIVIPLMTFVVWSSLIATLLSYIAPMAARIIALGTHYILALYTWLGRFASGLPCSTILIGRPSLWQICVYYCLFFFVLYSSRLKVLIPALRSSMSDRETAST